MSILLNGFAPLIHCSSAGFQPPWSSSLFTHFCSINKHAQALKWNNVPCGKKKSTQLDVPMGEKTAEKNSAFQ